ncbi:BTAD domain-containing putative transcriptional regulator [Amycolatopsis sp. NPDC051045]|uniref:AfsR/SARP family transcriptional regulator n=1 Tax=Amycolatopsis sp. NPDC051045 TaxID=3156922 RepID=UPI00342A3FB4
MVTLGGVLRDGRSATGSVRLTLTGEFELFVGGERRTVPHSVERVLAYLALTERPVSRTKLAGILWFGATEKRAANNLRTTLWRLGRTCGQLVSAGPDRLVLSSAVKVDAAELSGLAQRLIHDPAPDDLGDLPSLVACADLLPDWDDRWVAADRERLRLLRLEALERAASALIERHCLGDALVAALASVQSEPLRESCRRLVVEVHVTEGNVAEALRSYNEYRALLRDELGIEPSDLMQRLIEPLGLWSRGDGGVPGS